MRQLYLDYNATTPIAPTVQQAMAAFLSEHYGNPSSSHMLGRAAAEAIEDAQRVAGLIGAEQDEVIFTSGGTESNNLALKGVMLRRLPLGSGHLVISAFEHPSVLEPARFLERLGYDVTLAPCDRNGVVTVDAIESVLQPNTVLVSVMHANNELGVIQPIREIAQVCRPRGILVHTDAAQAVGKIPTFVSELDIDLLTIAGHKFYAPKGVGALYVRNGVALEPILHGAAHEGGLRAGTENTPYIVALGSAAQLAAKGLDAAAQRLGDLRDMLENRLRTAIGDRLTVNGSNADRLPNTSNVAFPDITGSDLLAHTPEICASTGAACHSGTTAISRSLAALGLTAEQARGCVRLSLGWYTSEEDVERAANLLINAWEDLCP